MRFRTGVGMLGLFAAALAFAAVPLAANASSESGSHESAVPTAPPAQAVTLQAPVTLNFEFAKSLSQMIDQSAVRQTVRQADSMSLNRPVDAPVRSRIDTVAFNASTAQYRSASMKRSRINRGNSATRFMMGASTLRSTSNTRGVNEPPEPVQRRT